MSTILRLGSPSATIMSAMLNGVEDSYGCVLPLLEHNPESHSIRSIVPECKIRHKLQLKPASLPPLAIHRLKEITVDSLVEISQGFSRPFIDLGIIAYSYLVYVLVKLLFACCFLNY